MFEMTNELADYVNRGMPCIFAGGNPHEKIGCFEAEKGVLEFCAITGTWVNFIMVAAKLLRLLSGAFEENKEDWPLFQSVFPFTV